MMTTSTQIDAKNPKEVVDLEKQIEYYYFLIRRGIDVSKNNEKIEECLKEKCKYYFAINQKN